MRVRREAREKRSRRMSAPNEENEDYESSSYIRELFEDLIDETQRSRGVSSRIGGELARGRGVIYERYYEEASG